MKDYYVYILSNKKDNIYYTGVTNNIIRRTYEHREKIVPGYTSWYNIRALLYYEIHNDINEAIKREKEIKDWRREKKRQLILSMNPSYVDLWEEIIQ